MNYNFRKDLKEAEQIEDVFDEWMKSHGYTTERRHDNAWDIKATHASGAVRTFELKCDAMSSDTGNVAIEFECRGKESGLYVTQADYWIQYFNEYFHIISVEKLKSIVKEISFKKVYGGDKGSRTGLFLIKNEVFKKHCDLII